MRRFIFKILLFAPILLLIAVANYFIDPANLYRRSVTISNGSSYEEGIAAYNAAGYHVTNVESLDERLYQKHFILSGAKNNPHLVIMGTSRSQLIGQDLFPGETLLNNSVTGATVEDLLGFLYLYDSIRYVPKTIMIELAPWYLNEENGQSRWKTIEPEYNAFLDNIGSTAERRVWQVDPRLAELVSFTYFQSSLAAWISSQGQSENNNFFTRDEFVGGYTVSAFHRQISEKLNIPFGASPPDTIQWFNSILGRRSLLEELADTEQEMPDELMNLRDEVVAQRNKTWAELSQVERQHVYRLNRELLGMVFYETCPPSEAQLSFPTRNADNAGLTRKADGTISYPEAFRNQTVGQVRAAVQSFLGTPIFGLSDYNELSGQKEDLIGTAIDYLDQRNVRVVLLLVPYHPDVFKVIKSDPRYRNVFHAEEFYRRLAKEKGLVIQGSYDPAACGLTEEEFYDAMHPKESAFIKIFNTLIPI